MLKRYQHEKNETEWKNMFYCYKSVSNTDFNRKLQNWIAKIVKLKINTT